MSRVLRWGIKCVLSLILLFGCLITGVYFYYAPSLPSVTAIKQGHPQWRQGLKLYDREGRLLWVKGDKRTRPQMISKIPPLLILAFLASEDHRFFQHIGVDLRGIIRVVWMKLIHGGRAQGASTLTQQLAKSWVGSERTLGRKIKEALLAFRMESVLSKQQLLERYLNQVYLGRGAYGVSEAAWTYFRKSLSELTLSESTLLAALPPRPSQVNPVRQWNQSINARDHVIDRMYRLQLITDEMRNQALSDKPHIFKRDDQLNAWAPDYLELARLKLKSQGVEDGIIELALHLPTHRVAERSLKKGLESLGRRQGYIGPVARIQTAQQRSKLLQELVSVHKARARIEKGTRVDRTEFLQSLDQQRRRLGVITKINSSSAEIDLGWRTSVVHLRDTKWARPYQVKQKHNRARPLKNLKRVFQLDDVVWVEASKRDQDNSWSSVRLSPAPVVEGALIELDHRVGDVRALIGGYDFQRSRFNRATQACRSLGSTLKPFIFALALEEGRRWDELLSDAPLSIYDHTHQLIWKPRGGHRSNGVGVSMYRSLIHSLNLPVLHLTQQLGVKKVHSWLERFQFTEQPQDLSMVLGSGCSTPLTLTQAYASIPRAGVPVDPHFIKRYVNAEGEIGIDRSDPFEPWLSEMLMIRALARWTLTPKESWITPQTAHKLQRGLKGVIQKGTGRAARNFPVEVAGKTGTTDLYDAWFVGYHDRSVVTIWVGSESNDRPIGSGETGGKTSLPIWLDFVRGTLEGVPKRLSPLIDERTDSAHKDTQEVRSSPSDQKQSKPARRPLIKKNHPHRMNPTKIKEMEGHF